MNDPIKEKYNEVIESISEMLEINYDAINALEIVQKEKGIEPDEYDNKLLLHVTKVFAHVLFNKVYFRMKKKTTFEQQCELVEDLGGSIRKMIKTWTGVDLHDIN